MTTIEALTAEVAELKALEMSHDGACVRLKAERDAALAREAGLRSALRGVQQGESEDGPCWCMYVLVVHPPGDPQDGVEVEANGHMKECNRARAALAATGEERHGE